MTNVPIAMIGLLALAGCEQAGWSPGDAQLVYFSNHEGVGGLYLQDGTSGAAVRIGPLDSVANFPEWSPDGERIVFQDRRHGHFDLWVMSARGGAARPLVENPGEDYLPSFSPDGTRLAFTARREAEGEKPRPQHHVLDLESGEERALALPEPGTSAGIAWCPDGRTVVSTWTTEQIAGALVRGTIDGSEWTRLTEGAGYDGSPAVSPDGTQIAYHSEDETGSRIYVCGIDGTGRRVIVDDGVAWSPRWSPDGRWLLYTARAGNDIIDLDLRAVRVDGHERPITVAGGPGRQSEGRWRPVLSRR